VRPVETCLAIDTGELVSVCCMGSRRCLASLNGVLNKTDSHLVTRTAIVEASLGGSAARWKLFLSDVVKFVGGGSLDFGVLCRMM